MGLEPQPPNNCVYQRAGYTTEPSPTALSLSYLQLVNIAHFFSFLSKYNKLSVAKWFTSRMAKPNRYASIFLRDH